MRPADLDPLGHVNNAAYLDYLEETVLAAGDGRRRGGRALATVRPPRVPAPGGGGRDRRRGGLAGRRPTDDGAGWAWRLADAAGTELARGRLGPGTFEPIDADRSGG